MVWDILISPSGQDWNYFLTWVYNHFQGGQPPVWAWGELWAGNTGGIYARLCHQAGCSCVRVLLMGLSLPGRKVGMSRTTWSLRSLQLNRPDDERV